MIDKILRKASQPKKLLTNSSLEKVHLQKKIISKTITCEIYYLYA